jgi:hypothetical protein
MNIKLFILLFLISFTIIILISLCGNKEAFTDKEKEKKELIPNVKRPYVNLFDDKGNKLNVILISKPFGTDKELKIYEDNKKNNIFLGISSYLEFPNIPSNPFEDWKDKFDKYKYKEICDGWIHGFRDPDKYFPPDIPLHFASESDWIDCNVSKPDEKIEKTFDFIYICLKVDDKKSLCDDWATYNKNWGLAKKCLDIFCNKFKLKGLLIGRKGCELPNGCSYMESTNMLKYDELQKSYKKAKFIFVPNEKDASPRVLTEALSNNLACLVNKNILGGWKYVNDKTGELFTDEKDVEKAVEKLLDGLKNNKYTPRDYYVTNYSVEHSGRRLKDFLYKHWEDRINIPKEKVDYISPEFSKKDFKTCKSSVL